MDRQLLVGGWSAEVRDLVSVLAVAHHADATGDDSDLLAADCWCRLALARGRGIQPQVEGISSHSGNLGELKLGKTRGYTRYSAGAPAAFLSRQDRKAPNTARQHSPV